MKLTRRYVHGDDAKQIDVYAGPILQQPQQATATTATATTMWRKQLPLQIIFLKHKVQKTKNSAARKTLVEICAVPCSFKYGLKTFER